MTQEQERLIERKAKEFFRPDMAHEGMRARFWAKVDKRGPDECWPWRGSLGRRGYGTISIGYKSTPAHRYSYLLHCGLEDHSLVIDHVCRNRGCVNPAHLRAITSVENVLCGMGYTARNRRKTHCGRGHEYTPENIYRPSHNLNERRCLQCSRDMSRDYQRAKRERERAAKAALAATLHQSKEIRK